MSHIAGDVNQVITNGAPVKGRRLWRESKVKKVGFELVSESVKGGSRANIMGQAIPQLWSIVAETNVKVYF